MIDEAPKWGLKGQRNQFSLSATHSILDSTCHHAGAGLSSRSLFPLSISYNPPVPHPLFPMRGPSPCAHPHHNAPPSAARRGRRAPTTLPIIAFHVFAKQQLHKLRPNGAGFFCFRDAGTPIGGRTCSLLFLTLVFFPRVVSRLVNHSCSHQSQHVELGSRPGQVMLPRDRSGPSTVRDAHSGRGVRSPEHRTWCRRSTPRDVFRSSATSTNACDRTRCDNATPHGSHDGGQ